MIYLCIKAHETTPKLLSNLIGDIRAPYLRHIGLRCQFWVLYHTLIMSEYWMYGIRSHKHRSLNPKTGKTTFHSLEASHEVSIKHCFSRKNKTLNTAIFRAELKKPLTNGKMRAEGGGGSMMMIGDTQRTLLTDLSGT